MPPTKSRYTKDVERNNKVFTTERALGPKDYLDIWASDNGEEVIRQERLDEEAATASPKGRK